MSYRHTFKLWSICLVALMAVFVATLPTSATTPAGTPPVAWTANFSGTPVAPLDFCTAEFDCAVHVRNPAVAPPQMQAQHGADCSAFPSTHTTLTYANAIFQCNNHVMTAIFSEGYGEVALTPDRLVDISGGTAMVNFSVSSYRSSARDWWDVYFTPFNENVVLPVDTSVTVVDVQGPPKDGFHVRLGGGTQNSVVFAEEFANYESTTVAGDRVTSIQSLVCPQPPAPPVVNCFLSGSASNRTPFEVDFSTTHFKFGISACAPHTPGCLPGGNPFWFANVNFPYPLTSTQYVLQLTHHSYNPRKDCQPTSPCQPNTWHWGPTSISRAVPFTVDKALPAGLVDATGSIGPFLNAQLPVTVNLTSPAPAGGHLRFTALGDLSANCIGLNCGICFVTAVQNCVANPVWYPAIGQNQQQPLNFSHFSSYWMPIPTGWTGTQIVIKGMQQVGINQSWMLRDIAVWSLK